MSSLGLVISFSSYGCFYYFGGLFVGVLAITRRALLFVVYIGAAHCWKCPHSLLCHSTMPAVIGLEYKTCLWRNLGIGIEGDILECSWMVHSRADFAKAHK